LSKPNFALNPKNQTAELQTRSQLQRLSWPLLGQKGLACQVEFLPVVGDVVDLFGIIVLYPLIGKFSLLGSAELVPILDFLPVFIGAVIMSKMKGGQK